MALTPDDTPTPKKVTYTGHEAGIEYTVRLTKYGRDTGVMVSITSNIDPKKLEAIAAKLDAFAIRKHREVEMAWAEYNA